MEPTPYKVGPITIVIHGVKLWDPYKLAENRYIRYISKWGEITQVIEVMNYNSHLC